jgi:endonuclease/exonuclease/phosphatase family metal-dependent hydrolase
MGDFNVVAGNGHQPGASQMEYELLRNSLHHGGQPLVDLWPALHASRGGTRDALAQENCDRIDYIFISSGFTTGGAWLEPASIAVAPFLDSNVKEGSLSDHAGVASTLTLRHY